MLCIHSENCDNCLTVGLSCSPFLPLYLSLSLSLPLSPLSPCLSVCLSVCALVKFVTVVYKCNCIIVGYVLLNFDTIPHFYVSLYDILLVCVSLTTETHTHTHTVCYWFQWEAHSVSYKLLASGSRSCFTCVLCICILA